MTICFATNNSKLKKYRSAGVAFYAGQFEEIAAKKLLESQNTLEGNHLKRQRTSPTNTTSYLCDDTGCSGGIGRHTGRSSAPTQDERRDEQYRPVAEKNLS